MLEELWMEVRDIVQEAVIKTIPKKKKCKKAKWLSEEALQIAEKRRDVKRKGEEERCIHLNAEFQRIARRDKKAFLSDQCKKRDENNIQRTKIMASGPITSWQTDGETMETVTDYAFGLQNHCRL